LPYSNWKRIVYCTVWAIAFVIALPGNAKPEQIPIKTYTTSEGLAQNTVNRIVRDSRGFLWFCTEGGLSRYDGYSFTNYAVEQGLPGGPGYFFNRKTLRPLTDASGGRVRRFCVESTVRLLDGSRLTPTNAIQAGEMRYHDGGSSPYHRHVGTPANPDGPSHCYITFKGRGVVQVGDDTQELEPGTLVFFPTGVPHRLRAKGGPLDYFELQAWKSFKTDVLSEEKLGLKWYYDPVTPGAERVEWDQT